MNKIKYILVIGFPILGLGVITFIVVSTVLGWYTNVNQMGEINANTKNVGFSYTINGEELQEDEYQISNLAFFDVDSMYEGSYFSDMCFEIKLNVKNITDTPLNYSITFESEKLKTAGVTSSYVGCVMSTSRLGFKPTADNAAVEGKKYYTYSASTNDYTEYTEIDAEDPIADDMKLYEFDPDFIPADYGTTEDNKFQVNKIYYQKSGDNYIAYTTRSSNIEMFKKASGITNIYEGTYNKVTNEAYNSSTDYYAYVENSNGNYYAKVTNANENNYKNYYTLVPGVYPADPTTDKVFQNELYFYGTNHTPLTLLIPGTSTNISSYYEKGSYVESLFDNNTPDITYTTDSDTSFKVEYSGGALEPKSDTSNQRNDNQTIYLYLIGVQEIDTAKNSDFIFNEHKFTIKIESSTDSTWTVTDVTTTPENNNNNNNGD